MQDLDDFAKSDLDKLERLEDNFKWIYEEYDSLKEKWDNRYVAIKNKKVLDVDTDFEKLVKRLNIRNYEESIAIEYIYK
jgi:ribosome biogenesis SPOUT family RNA methylase Rps3